MLKSFQLLCKNSFLMRHKTSSLDPVCLGFSLKIPVFKMAVNGKGDNIESKSHTRKPNFPSQSQNSQSETLEKQTEEKLQYTFGENVHDVTDQKKTTNNENWNNPSDKKAYDKEEEKRTKEFLQ